MALHTSPVVGWLITFFMGTAGGVAGSLAVSAATKKEEQKTQPATPAKLSGGSDVDVLSGPVAISCDWRRAKNSDLDQSIVAAYVDQLKTPVGTHRTVQHGGKTWLLETVSFETDPDFTKNPKDVRGWIRVKGSQDLITNVENIVIEEKVPQKLVVAPTALRLPMTTHFTDLSGNDNKSSYTKMKIEDGKVVPDSGNAVDDLGKGPLNEKDEIGDADFHHIDTDLGLSVPIRTVADAKKWGLPVSENTVANGKWGMTLKEKTGGGFAVPVKVVSSSPSKSPPVEVNRPATASGPAKTNPVTASGPTKVPSTDLKQSSVKPSVSIPKTAPVAKKK